MGNDASQSLGGNPVARFVRWARGLVAEVPADVAVCEFDCTKTTCRSADFEACRRRREAMRGASPRGRDDATAASSLDGARVAGERALRRPRPAAVDAAIAGGDEIVNAPRPSA